VPLCHAKRFITFWVKLVYQNNTPFLKSYNLSLICIIATKINELSQWRN